MHTREKKCSADLNKAFLDVVSDESKSWILSSIAKHYGVEQAVIYKELVGRDAEHILEYMAEPERSAAAVLMKKAALKRQL